MAATAITDNDSVNYFLFFVFGFMVSLALVSLSIAVHIAMEKMYPDNPRKEESPVITFRHIEWPSAYINNCLSNESWKTTIISIICSWKSSRWINKSQINDLYCLYQYELHISKQIVSYLIFTFQEDIFLIIRLRI